MHEISPDGPILDGFASTESSERRFYDAFAHSIMARVRFLLAALVAASLVSFVAAGGGESSGEDECGESAIWTVNAGETKRCCTY